MKQPSDVIYNKARAIIGIFAASKAVLAGLETDKLPLTDFLRVVEPFPMQPESALTVLHGIDAVTLHTEDLTLSFADHIKLPPLETLKTTFRQNADQFGLPADVKAGYLHNAYLLTTYLYHLTRNITIVTTEIDPQTGITNISFPKVTAEQARETMDFFLA